MEDLVNIILVSGGLRLHMGITKEAERRALELLNREKESVSDKRRTEIFRQAIKEFPVIED